MDIYYDAGGGCFHGDCVTNLIGKRSIKIKDLKKGD